MSISRVTRAVRVVVITGMVLGVCVRSHAMLFRTFAPEVVSYVHVNIKKAIVQTSEAYKKILNKPVLDGKALLASHKTFSATLLKAIESFDSENFKITSDYINYVTGEIAMMLDSYCGWHDAEYRYSYCRHVKNLLGFYTYLYGLNGYSSVNSAYLEVVCCDIFMPKKKQREGDKKVRS